MKTRREFLNGMIGAGTLAALGAKPAAAQDKRRLIVDAQVHLWKGHSPERPWPNPEAKAQLPEPFGYDKMLPLMDEAGVDRAVIVPPSGWEGEHRNDYALEAVAKHPGRFGIMGTLPMADPKSRALIPGWKKQRGMLGIRASFTGTRLAYLDDGSADWLWPACEKAGIPVMFIAPRVGAAVRIAERHPGLTLIMDHMGLTGDMVAKGHKQELIDATVAMAKYPNVSVKLSSVPAYSTEPYPWRDMTVHVRRCFDAYGPRRCYWGCDITNSLAKATYRQRIEHFTRELDFFSEDDRDWIMGRSLLARLNWT